MTMWCRSGVRTGARALPADLDHVRGEVLRERDLGRASTIPSPKRKPAASSKSFPGVRIVTATGSPLRRISSGSSTATRSVAPSRSTAFAIEAALWSMVSPPGPSAPRARRAGAESAAATGSTDTATTLYSGQEVFTSADGPISRLVRTSGKWKAVNTWPGSIRSVTRRGQPDLAAAAAHRDRPRRPPRRARAASSGWTSSQSALISSRLPVRRVIVPAL